MHQAATWLLALATIISQVDAFYPFHQPSGSSGDHSKRLPHAESGVIRAPLHRVRRDGNQFAISFSNKPSAPNALAINQDGSDYSYLSTFQFGSKPQPMYMLIDTGSPSTWVFGSECTTKSCTIHNTFGKEDSTSLKTNTDNFSLAYGTGQVSGYTASDTVSFANFTTTLSFGVATTASDDFEAYPMDGIAGLGRGSSPVGTTMMDVLVSSKLISSKLIGVHIHRAADNTKDGEIMFGGLDTLKYSGQIYWTNTTSNSGWEIPIDGANIDNKPLAFTDNITAIIDTGTTFLLLPPPHAKIFHAAIPGSSPSGEAYSVPCNTNLAFEVKINGQLFSVLPKDYVGKPVSTGSASCISNVIGHQAFGATQWILGDVFLKNTYSVFDYDNSRIGLAREGTGGILPGNNSTSSSASNTTTVSPTASTTSSHTPATNSAKPTASDSNIGGGSGTNSSAATHVVSYWKVGLSICLIAVALTV